MPVFTARLQTRLNFVIFRRYNRRYSEELKHMNEQPKPNKKPFFYYAMIAMLILMLLNAFVFPSLMTPRVTEVSYDKFLDMLSGGQVTVVELQENERELYFKAADENGAERIYSTGVFPDADLQKRLSESGVTFSAVAPQENSTLMNFLFTWIFPTLILILPMVLLWRMMQKRMGDGSNMMSFGMGKSNAKMYVAAQTGKTFADVAGQEEAKEALEEIVDFLHNPDKYRSVGAVMPKGVLLVGPPGTGKTLLAKAVAGEANVPFFSIAGSEFVEMFVGQGAARVRDLFKQAKEKAPCIVFIDEIDAIGQKRNSGQLGGNDEREQTLNQLLAEMDGFDGKKGVVILAATNRPDSLDPALLRPGRFDRRVPVELPDLKGREEILKVHAKNIRVGDNVDYNAIARMASGASGAELANMINEAALRAVRDGRKFVTQADLEESVEVVIAGYQKKNKIMTDKEKLIVSYHEVGHALVAALQSHSAPVTKITIIPRTSGALGYTMQVDEDEHNLMSREELENKIATLTGGRVAEDLVFHSITTGASNDIEQATKVARAMITRFGMNEEFGMVAFETVTNQYLGGDTSLACSESTAAQIDEKVVAAVRKQYDKAEQLLKDNMPKLHELAKYLYEKETITGDEFMEILNLSPDQLTTTRMETN